MEADGVLLIDKPSGCTSHDVVDYVRNRFRFKKVGHCGTLDPLATGLLMLVIGKATKIQDLLMAEDKEYAATMKLGS
jgi:tRNA pseudouridine55 synthase